MRPRRHPAPTPSRVDPNLLLPPNLRTLGLLSFTRLDRDTLDAWLAEDGWPRDRMNIAMLEGYLVALLVWPVGVSPGVWLPPIWGGQGWKVPMKIASPEAYVKFTALVIGFLHELDCELGARPPHFTPTFSRTEPATPGRTAPGMSWAQGFLRALQQNLEGLTWRSTAARHAVARIGHHASFTAPSARADAAAAADLTSAVLTLAAERASRGPLGRLPSENKAPVMEGTENPTPSRTAPHRTKPHD